MLRGAVTLPLPLHEPCPCPQPVPVAGSCLGTSSSHAHIAAGPTQTGSLLGCAGCSSRTGSAWGETAPWGSAMWEQNPLGG